MGKCCINCDPNESECFTLGFYMYIYLFLICFGKCDANWNGYCSFMCRSNLSPNLAAKIIFGKFEIKSAYCLLAFWIKAVKLNMVWKIIFHKPLLHDGLELVGHFCSFYCSILILTPKIKLQTI